MANTVQEMFSSFYGPDSPYNQKGGLFGGGVGAVTKERYKETGKDIQDLLDRMAKQGGEAPTVAESFGAALGTSFGDGFGTGLMGDPEMEKAKQRDQLAKEYQEATKDMAPNDPNRYILQAQILGQLGDFEGQTKSLTLANTLLEEASEYPNTSSKEDRELTAAYLVESDYGDLDSNSMRLATQEITDDALSRYNKQKQDIKEGRLDPKAAEPLKTFIRLSINTAIDEKKLNKKDGWFSDSVKYTSVKAGEEDNPNYVEENNTPNEEPVTKKEPTFFSATKGELQRGIKPSARSIKYKADQDKIKLDRERKQKAYKSANNRR